MKSKRGQVLGLWLAASGLIVALGGVLGCETTTQRCMGEREACRKVCDDKEGGERSSCNDACDDSLNDCMAE